MIEVFIVQVLFNSIFLKTSFPMHLGLSAPLVFFHAFVPSDDPPHLLVTIFIQQCFPTEEKRATDLLLQEKTSNYYNLLVPVSFN